MKWTLFLLAAMLWTGAAGAVVPWTMSYQGMLREAGGTIPPDA